MERSELYAILDIEDPKEFTFYENMASLLEEDRVIPEELIEELVKEIDPDTFSELLGSYFDEFLKRIPDELVDLYITVETIQRTLAGAEDASALSEELARFRRWYVVDPLVTDRDSGEELSVRDARYNVAASTFTEESCAYDFDRALDYGASGYNVRMQDLI